MKRLFCVKDSAGRVLSGGTAKQKYFTASKLEAKAYRDTCGGISKGFYVSRGPDHIGPHGHKIRRMRLQPKRVQ